MSKQFYTRDEVKSFLRKAIRRKRGEADADAKPAEAEQIFSLEEVEAILCKEHEARSK